jgi:alanine racemase
VVKKTVKAQGFEDVRFHSHNSASILRTKHFSEELVRVGIGAYGYNELPACFETPSLKPVLSLHAKRIATRALTQGQRVGYGGDFIAPKAMVVSTYDVGYGDGLMRGNYTSSPLLTAKNLPLLGRVSMDFVTLESQEEEVCIFDDAKMFAKQLGTISYEVLTLLKKELPREVC